MPGLTRRRALHQGGGAVGVLLAGCTRYAPVREFTNNSPIREFEDTAGTARLALVGANMQPQGMTFYLRSTLTSVPLCRYTTTSCAKTRRRERLVRAEYDLGTDEVSPLADVAVDLREGYVDIVTIRVNDEPFEQWSDQLPESQRLTGAEAGADRLSDDLRSSFSLVPDATRTVRITNRIHRWEFLTG